MSPEVLIEIAKKFNYEELREAIDHYPQLLKVWYDPYLWILFAERDLGLLREDFGSEKDFNIPNGGRLARDRYRFFRNISYSYDELRYLAGRYPLFLEILRNTYRNFLESTTYPIYLTLPAGEKMIYHT